MTWRFLIDGELVSSNQTFGVVDPSTGDVFAYCPDGGSAELERAVAGAQRAFSPWSQTPIEERSRLVNRIGDIIQQHSERFATLLGQEQGKPLAQGMWEVLGAVEFIRCFASMRLDDVVLKDDAEARIVRRRAPLGIVGAIAPWNYPLLILITKIAPALVAGNTVIAKPAPTTPLTALLLGELLVNELPAGVLNIVSDSGDLGPLMTSHAAIASITFTGSTDTGRKVMAAGASTLKRLVLELGGNDAAIVLGDADVAKVASALFNGSMANSGQLCAAIKRAYVHESIYDGVCAELSRLAEQAIVGPYSDPDSQFGPVQNKVQFERVKGLLSDASLTGNIVAGGLPEEGRPGYFIRPTIVRDVDDKDRIVKEEQFGPVLPVLKFSQLDEVIARVNDSPYGLTATVWTSDIALGEAIAGRINVGQVWVNKHLDGSPMIAAEGSKGSGLGMQYGQEGLEEFTQPTVINVARSVENSPRGEQ